MTIDLDGRWRVRTTIEMRDQHRAALLEIAGQRGLKGFSAVVGEAIDAYLEAEVHLTTARKAALAVRGSVSAAEADRLSRITAAIRESWR
jgi:hypothetical protein